MALEQFIDANFGPARRLMIDRANVIIDEYQEAGIKLTLRSLYYQFVARGLIDNVQSEYKKLTTCIAKARLAGLVDWDAIEDITRHLRNYQVETSPRDACLRVAKTYIEDLWLNQQVYIEQWIEKDAGLNTIVPACGRWRLPHFACRGNASQTALYDAGVRLSRQLMFGKHVVVLYIGDHDPTGVDISRDNQDRLDLFARETGIELRRIALNMDQIEQYNPPPNPVKDTDSRSDAYRETYGTDKCWELDALDPRVIDELIEAEVSSYVDQELWDEDAATEAENRDKLYTAARAMDL